MTHPLDGPIYTAPERPTICPSCFKVGRALAAVLRGAWECSRGECPLRNRHPVVGLPVKLDEERDD